MCIANVIGIYIHRYIPGSSWLMMTDMPEIDAASGVSVPVPETRSFYLHVFLRETHDRIS